MVHDDFRFKCTQKLPKTLPEEALIVRSPHRPKAGRQQPLFAVSSVCFRWVPKASRLPQDGPTEPQEAPQRTPRWPKGLSRGAPKRFMRAPRGIYSTSEGGGNFSLLFLSLGAQDCSKRTPRPHQRAPRAPHPAQERQEGPKRAPRRPEEDSKRASKGP